MCVIEGIFELRFGMPECGLMQPLPDATSTEFIFPQPDAEGIAETQKLYFNKVGRSILESEASEVLGRVMRYLFLLNMPCSNTESTPENPMTTAQ